MRKIYYNPNMKKCIFALCALLVCALPVFAQHEAAMDENPDSIKVSYVPNRFGDNWELSISGGISVLERHPHLELLLVGIRPMMPLVE